MEQLLFRSTQQNEIEKSVTFLERASDKMNRFVFVLRISETTTSSTNLTV